MNRPGKPEGKFTSNVPNPAGTPTPDGGQLGATFKLKVYGQDQYLNIDGSGWCFLGSTPLDWREYEYAGKKYLKPASGDWTNYYLSVSNNLYVGVYGWTNASDFEIQRQPEPWVYLKAWWNEQFAGTHPNYSFVLAWNEATPIKFERF